MTQLFRWFNTDIEEEVAEEGEEEKENENKDSKEQLFLSSTVLSLRVGVEGKDLEPKSGIKSSPLQIELAE